MISSKSFFKGSWLSKLLFSFQSLLYPPLCLHCEASLSSEYPIFCQECLDQLVLINPKERCPWCFSSDYLPESHHCPECRLKKNPGIKMTAAFDYMGPAYSLIKRLKYGQQPHLAKGAGAYLAAQFIQVKWPLPDCIVPVPISPLRKFERGFNQSELLAQTLGKILDRPVRKVLKRRLDVPSQVDLPQDLRILRENPYFLKKRIGIMDQHILLVDDVASTGETLSACGNALLAGFPKTVSALTVCKAI